jgi:hypothetical protein
VRHRPRRIVTVLLGLAGLALLGNPSPISAGAAQFPIDLRPTCGDGAITRAEPISTHGALTIEGWLNCAQPAGASLSFGFARYFTNNEIGIIPSYEIEPYDPISQTVFAQTKTVTVIPQNFGICVVNSYHTRVACVRVTRAVPYGPLVVQQVPPNDPSVNKPASIVQMSPTVPNCGTCW